MPAARSRRRSVAAAQSPNAPSTWTHALVRGRRVADRAEVLERAGVHVAGLRGDDRRQSGSRASSRSSSSGMTRPWSSQGTGRSASRPKPSTRTARSIVTWRSSGTTMRTGGAPCRPVLVDVPAAALEHRAARGHQAGDVRHLAAGREAERAAVGQPEELARPGARRPPRPARSRAARIAAGVLVPGDRQPVGGLRTGSTPPMTKPK